MIQASSLRSHGNQKRRMTIVIAIVCVVVVIVLGVMFFGGSGSSKNEQPAQSLPIQDDIVSRINDLPFNVSQPEKIPQGFMRTIVKIVESQSTRSGCDEVVQLYSLVDEDISEDLSDEEFVEELRNKEATGYIDIYSYSEECSFPRPDDAEPFTVGDYSGWVSDSDPDSSVLFELTVNQSVVRIETDLLRNEVRQVLEKFVPFSATPPESSIEIVVP